MARLKKRYRLCLEYEVEVKDHTEIPVYPNEFLDLPGEYVVERLIHVRELLARLMENPETLESYMKHCVLSLLEDDIFDLEKIAPQLGIELDSDKILQPVLDSLDEKARLHFAVAKVEEGEYEALLPFWGAFEERLIGVNLEEAR